MLSDFLRYKPTPVILPVDGPLSRSFLDPRQHLGDRPPLEQSDYGEFDTHHLFHDVYLDTDGNYLRAVGPPMVNLKKALMPITVTVCDVGGDQPESATLKHKLYAGFRLSRHRFALPRQYRHSAQLRVKIQCANGLVFEQAAVRQILKPVTLQFTTLQKDNPVEWIVDWIRYCQSQGVQRILLYDNGSENVDQIEHVLRTLDLGIQIVLVDWPYPYGPRRSYYNRFTQASQNNHSYHCFGNAEWTGHFDIDEYPVTYSADSLIELLERVSRRVGLLRFDSYLFHNIREPSGTLPTVRDFHYRSRSPHQKSHKYIARTKALTLSKIHNGRVRFGFWRLQVKPATAVFHHFMGLTGNWRGDDPRQHLMDYNPQRDVEDLTLTSRFQELDAGSMTKL